VDSNMPLKVLFSSEGFSTVGAVKSPFREDSHMSF